MTAMCRRFLALPINAVDACIQGAAIPPAFEPASPEAESTLLGAPPQTDASHGVDAEAAGQHIGLVPGGVPHGATSAVGAQPCG